MSELSSREAIARIIDPRIFKMDEDCANQYTTDGIKEALRKADAILAHGAAQTPLAALVREWRCAQKAIDALTVEQRRADHTPLDRLVAAHQALIAYADDHLTRK
jgi:hypothetical protein